MMKRIGFILLLGSIFATSEAQTWENKSFPGYKPIWFELNQKYPYGDKYSGALGTYTAKHRPLAIYAPMVDKTFFVYGGTTSDTARHLLCMIGVYDHSNGTVSRPTVVCDKLGVDDPHDNPSILLDEDGYIWVFVSGRGRIRPGFKYRSKLPFDISTFELIHTEEMTYPQPWISNHGQFHFFTKYTGVRQLYFESSMDGLSWTDDQLLAAIPDQAGEKSGHYQVSLMNQRGVAGTFFSRHPQGNVDKRTDLFYVQTSDLGKSWTTVDGKTVSVPIIQKNHPTRVIDYASQNKNVYLKDMVFDRQGNPFVLYIRSNGHEPGPDNGPYEWCVTYWDSHQWKTRQITTSDHNYDMGSLWIDSSSWVVLAPTEVGPQPWGVGGEIVKWVSSNQGKTWQAAEQFTENSPANHAYVRKVHGGKAPFQFFWADGHAHEFSKSNLYFGDWSGAVYQLPYDMVADQKAPVKIK